MKKIFVVVGGPGFGKTTLVQALEKKGFYCQYDDASREAIQEHERKGKVADTGSYRFNRLILERRVTQFENAPDNKTCFFDRGIPDCIAYMDSPSEEFLETARRYRYQETIFAVTPWRSIFKGHSEDTGRAEESFEEALRLHEIILKVYKSLGYRVIEVPKGDAEERADFVIKEVQKTETRKRLKFI